ncbi:MAG: hypothetical protein CL696_14235 [Chloroflexi bacterium]|nr:hypothetical protein [Chloroflexota bacterium]MDP6497072.1 hypothetical protein [Dehalococcoidia bacterium]MQG54392.1 hypothetical protein [SAR202 cluster bacterium]
MASLNRWQIVSNGPKANRAARLSPVAPTPQHTGAKGFSVGRQFLGGAGFAEARVPASMTTLP